MSNNVVPTVEIICNDVAGRLLQANQEVDKLRALTRALLKHVGTLGVCKACKADIYWVRHIDTAKTAPYDLDGTSHFATCPRAHQFRRKA